MDAWLHKRTPIDLLAERNRLAQDMPVLVLTELGVDYPRADWFLADATLLKPFQIAELISCARALLPGTIGEELDDLREAPAVSGGMAGYPRPRQDRVECLRFGSVEIDLNRQRVICNGRLLHLTPTEFNVVLALARCPGQIVTRSEIIQNVLGYDGVRETRTVDSHIASIRRKLGEERLHIQTAHGLGYRLDP